MARTPTRAGACTTTPLFWPFAWATASSRPAMMRAPSGGRLLRLAVMVSVPSRRSDRRDGVQFVARGDLGGRQIVRRLQVHPELRAGVGKHARESQGGVSGERLFAAGKPLDALAGYA